MPVRSDRVQISIVRTAGGWLDRAKQRGVPESQRTALTRVAVEEVLHRTPCTATAGCAHGFPYRLRRTQRPWARPRLRARLVDQPLLGALELVLVQDPSVAQLRQVTQLVGQ